MLFNSFEYLWFLPLLFLLYWFAAGKSLFAQNLLLLAGSYFFYGWWSWKFLLLLALSTLIDYLYGFGVASPNRRKAKLFLVLSIINNLSILFVFKYYNFFAAQFQQAFGLLGMNDCPPLLHLVLPVGISFYTFHGMSYVFDIYRGKQKPASSLTDYALFVSFFPLLVAGPIERASHLLPQIRKKRVFSYAQAVEGCRLFVWGMFKKVVIADGLAAVVNNIFQNYRQENGVTLMIGAIAFGFQIYCDFSGYSDIAMGTAKLLGFEIYSNFRFPYFSRDIAEFWRRWHISLSSWFRDYVYIPLGGSREGRLRAVRNVFIIFLLSGFWHGANWTFIAWGLLHACGFLPLLLAKKNRAHTGDVVAADRRWPTLRELGQMTGTFAFVTLAWIFFRSESIGMATGYVSRMVTHIFPDPVHNFQTSHGNISFLYIIPLIVADWAQRRNERSLLFPKNRYVRGIAYWALFYMWFSKLGPATSFIYFQF